MRKLKLLLALFWSLLIGVACLMTLNADVGITFQYKDKIVHFIFYFLFTILWFRYLDVKRTNWTLRKKLQRVFLAGFSYGVLIEICQGLFTATRTADVYDALANGIGSATAVLLLYCYRSRKIETSN